MTDDTKNPDEIDQLALDAHPEEQAGNDAGGASVDTQAQDASVQGATDGASAGEQGNVVAGGPSTDASASDAQPVVDQTASASGDSGNAVADAEQSSAASAETQTSVPVAGEQAAQTDGADVGNVDGNGTAAQAVPDPDASAITSDTGTDPVAPDAALTPEQAAAEVPATVSDSAAADAVTPLDPVTPPVTDSVTASPTGGPTAGQGATPAAREKHGLLDRLEEDLRASLHAIEAIDAEIAHVLDAVFDRHHSVVDVEAAS